MPLSMCSLPNLPAYMLSAFCPSRLWVNPGLPPYFSSSSLSSSESIGGRKSFISTLRRRCFGNSSLYMAGDMCIKPLPHIPGELSSFVSSTELVCILLDALMNHAALVGIVSHRSVKFVSANRFIIGSARSRPSIADDLPAQMGVLMPAPACILLNNFEHKSESWHLRAQARTHPFNGLGVFAPEVEDGGLAVSGADLICTPCSGCSWWYLA